jgi:hypothetical protein
VPLVIVVALVLLLAIAFIPLLFVFRFRLGSARRRGRTWLASVNVVMLAVSTVLVLITASIVNIWVPDALRSAAIGFACGTVLSVFGLVFTIWERRPEALFYKPNRWFALVVPMALMLRILYWMWRGWQAWGGSADAQSWFSASGTAGSLAVGAAVAGYYFGYALGVWQRVIRYQRSQ